MIIRHCVDHALHSLDLYEQSVRCSGRTTRMLAEVKEGDVVVSHRAHLALQLTKKLYDEKRIVAYAMSLDEYMKNSKQGFVIRGRSLGRNKIHFDSTAIEELLRMKLKELQQFIDKGYT